MKDIALIKEIMSDFSQRTALAGTGQPPRRYLWTDAFAVCNFLELYRLTDKKECLQEALDLVDQVHHTLGRHRKDNPQQGWISGLDEQEGARHPTIGGLRIGKKLNERSHDEAYDERLEWDRDGQYFHYLTKWMHALNRVTAITGDFHYNRLAIELAKTAHARFSHTLSPDQPKRMFWKMSIDLSRPLVPSMGQHDPLDAFITYNQLAATAASDLENPGRAGLDREITETLNIYKSISLTTDDPLGIGGLLSDAFRLFQLMLYHQLPLKDTFFRVLDAAGEGLHTFMLSDTLSYPAQYRLAFRELGLSIGLHALERIESMQNAHPEIFKGDTPTERQIAGMEQYLPLCETIEAFWLTPTHQQNPAWQEHIDINTVMLATSLAPDGYLMIN